MIFDEIRNQVIKEGFGVNTHTCPCLCSVYSVGFSKGIEIAIKDNSSMQKAVDNALMRFLTKDYGEMYGYGEEPVEGAAYGYYESPYGTEPYDGAIMIHEEHRDNYDYIVYFQFER